MDNKEQDFQLMKLELSYNSDLHRALVDFVSEELAEYASWQVVDGEATLELEGTWLTWPCATVAEALRLGRYAARNGETWGLQWTVDGDVLSIDCQRARLDQALYSAWRKQSPTGSVPDFRAWKARTFGGVTPLMYESQAPAWAWYDTLNEHIVELAIGAALELRRAEDSGDKVPPKAVAVLRRLASAAQWSHWLLLVPYEKAILHVLDDAGEINEANAFAVGNSIPCPPMRLVAV